MSLGHHRSLITRIDTAALMASTYHLSRDAEHRYRPYAAAGILRLSVGLEDAEDLCVDLDRVL